MKHHFFYKILAVSFMILLIFFLILCIETEYKNVKKYDGNDTEDTLLINEIMYTNLGLQKDADGDSSGWMEIYNYGQKSVNLYGKCLYIGEDGMTKWKFPNYKLGAGEYLIVWTSGKDKVTSNGELHSNFLIDANDKISLYDDCNDLIDEWDTDFNVPIGLSVGRLARDPQKLAVFSKSSPGAANRARTIYSISKMDASLEAPSFSHESGIYNDKFELSLYADDYDSVILYTLDGSEPTENSYIYKAPIVIKERSDEPNKLSDVITTNDYIMKYKWENTYNYKCTVVRARTMKNGALSDEIVTKSYFISPQTTFNIVSLSVNQEDMFGDKYGIYVPGNTYQLWKKYNKGVTSDFSSPANYYGNKKIKGHIQIFDKDGDICADDDVKVKVTGAASRSNAAKSLKLISDEDGFEGDIFEVLPISDFYKGADKCDAVTLRASGSDFNKTMFCDSLAISIIAGEMNASFLASQPSVLFINGEYWGIHNIREVCDANYFYRHYGIISENLKLIELNNGAVGEKRVEAGTEEDINEYYDLVDYVIKNDLADEDCYKYVSSKVDIDNLIDYCICQIYFGNYDWPGNNYRIWRADQSDSEYGDNKWRFVLYDLDRAFSYADFNSIEYVFNENYGEEILNGISHYHDENRELFYSLIKNKSFEEKFFNRLEACLDTTFSSENVVSQIETMRALYAPEMEAHFSRWHFTDGWLTKLRNMIKYNYSYNDTYTYENWEKNVEDMKAFARKRPEMLKEYIKQYREQHGKKKETDN